MASDSLTHDVAWATAMRIVEVFASCLREEEKKDAFIEVYTRVKAGLEHYRIRENRRRLRLRPGVIEHEEKE
jgi:hypothetical protein